MIPCIAEQRPLAAPFNSVWLTLDATRHSDLNWSDMIQKADAWVAEGIALFWHVDLGLFDELPLPIGNSAQLQPQRRAFEYFCETVWERFHASTVGCSFFRGRLNVDHATAAYDSFHCIAQQKPEGLKGYLCIDVTDIPPAEQARLLSDERVAPFLLAVKGALIPFEGLVWQEGKDYGLWSGAIGSSAPLSRVRPKLALCLPPSYSCFHALTPLFEVLEATQYQLVPASLLPARWETFDILIVVSELLTPSCCRMIQGFVAGGGRVVTYGASIGFAEEISFAEWRDME